MRIRCRIHYSRDSLKLVYLKPTNIIRTTLLFIISIIIHGTMAEFPLLNSEVKCFCDKSTCPRGSLICTGKWCLIGVRNEDGNGRLDQYCGTDETERPKDCTQKWNKYSEVCACDTNLCNTFAYLRSNIDKRSIERNLFASNNPEEERRLRHRTGGSSDYNDPNSRFVSQEGGRQNNNLIILLVIIPLCVGGFTVCLVFLNYHCKMQ